MGAVEVAEQRRLNAILSGTFRWTLVMLIQTTRHLGYSDRKHAWKTDLNKVA